jgi:hypothetical protein
MKIMHHVIKGSAFLALIYAVPSFADINGRNLFQRHLYAFDSSSSLDCQPSDEGVIPESQVVTTIGRYERANADLQAKSAALLTHAINPKWQKQFATSQNACRTDENPGRCILKRYWGSREIADRVLAIFYDTGVAIQRSNDDDHSAFTLSAINAIEKSIQKIPDALLAKMRNGGKPERTFDPDEPTVDGQVPLTINAEKSNGGNLGAVVKGINSISFAVKLLDKASSGRAYKDVGFEFNADFRLQMIIHEFGHVVDSFFFDNTKSSGFWDRHYVSTDSQFKPAIESSSAALWPSHWWDAFEGMDGITNGRYETNAAEKFGEFFAQYILMPQELRRSAPALYDRLKNDLFGGIEFRGYEECTNLVTPIPSWRRPFTPRLLR